LTISIAEEPLRNSGGSSEVLPQRKGMSSISEDASEDSTEQLISKGDTLKQYDEPPLNNGQSTSGKCSIFIIMQYKCWLVRVLYWEGL